MPPQQPAVTDAQPSAPHQPTAKPGRASASQRKSHGKVSFSQKELSVVVMLLAAETAVVTTTTAPAPAGSTGTTTIFTIAPEFAAAAGLSWLARQPLPKVDAAVLCAAKEAFVASGPDGLNAAARKAITSFLPWRDCLPLRQASKTWRVATDETVRVTTLPSNASVPAMFLPCPRDVDADSTTEARLKCRHQSKWRCPYCCFCNSETRILCGNRHCQIPCPSHLECARLFLGQLRREGTVPFLTWLVEGVLGRDANPMHIVNAENHRQLSTGRGKGCSWIYLASRDMAPTVLEYHHRVFADIDPLTKREGVWIVPAANADALSADVAARATFDTSRSLLLPRGSLVVEYPSRQPYATIAPEALPAPRPMAAAAASQQFADLPPPSYHAATMVQQHQHHPRAPYHHGERDSCVTPIDGHWIAPVATDSPPSETSGDEKASPNMMAASTATIPGAIASSTAAPSPTVRRHQPYRSPVAAGTPAIPTAADSPIPNGADPRYMPSPMMAGSVPGTPMYGGLLPPASSAGTPTTCIPTAFSPYYHYHASGNASRSRRPPQQHRGGGGGAWRRQAAEAEMYAAYYGSGGAEGWGAYGDEAAYYGGYGGSDYQQHYDPSSYAAAAAPVPASE